MSECAKPRQDVFVDIDEVVRPTVTASTAVSPDGTKVLVAIGIPRDTVLTVTVNGVPVILVDDPCG